jgi:thioredoxin 1
MSENTGSADDLDTIRERKRNRLRTGVDPASTADSSTDGIADGTDAAGGDDARTPTEPIVVDGVESFRTLLNDREVVLAEFSATWCGPCRTLEPILERVAARSPGAIATIDIDANPISHAGTPSGASPRCFCSPTASRSNAFSACRTRRCSRI